MDWAGLLFMAAVVVGCLFMIGWTWREARRQRWIRKEATKTDDPGRLRYLLWLVDRPEFKPWKRGDG